MIWESLVYKVGWFLGERLGLDYISKKIRGWENRQLESGLQIMGTPEVLVGGLYDKMPYLSIFIHLWSSVPIIFRPEKVVWKVKAKNYEQDLEWNRDTKDMNESDTIEEITRNKNRWILHAKPSLEILKTNVSSDWSIKFKAIFQHGFSKTFDVAFKIRDLEAKKIIEA